ETGIRPPAGFYAPKGENAAGGGVSAGQTYLVGENGPELFTPQSNGMISSHGATMARAQSGIYTTSGNTPNVNVNAPSPNVPAIYVQNPFTGEYLLAEVSTV